MEASEIREQVDEALRRPIEVTVEHFARFLVRLAVEVERLQQQRTDLENRLAAVERRVGAIEEPMP